MHGIIAFADARGNAPESFLHLLESLRLAERVTRYPWTRQASLELDRAILTFESASAAAWVQS